MKKLMILSMLVTACASTAHASKRDPRALASEAQVSSVKHGDFESHGTRERKFADHGGTEAR